MEQVWLGEFGQLFSSYLPHRWSLVPVSGTPLGSWNQFVDSAKVEPEPNRKYNDIVIEISHLRLEILS